MIWTTKELKAAVIRISAACEDAKPFLCDADSKLGDGDLGVTMEKGWKQIVQDSESWDENISKNFFQMSKSLQTACASSFGTLLATGFMAIAKYCKTQSLNTLQAKDISPIITEAYLAMIHRGKGELGQKSVLDILHNLACTFEHITDVEDLKIAAQKSVTSSLDDFRNKPNLLGRARMFPEKSIGLDDPGMLAIKVIVDAI